MILKASDDEEYEKDARSYEEQATRAGWRIASNSEARIFVIITSKAVPDSGYLDIRARVNSL